ncbi:zinc finger A20 and AN1 domain-containing stress-associated protein 1-like [Abrus precatorius]|uniref:Zinc finger A20 and AN1 domain-containing stress-associated protein 1-like n=1 Tax=Abrus precatorius TaxID=3816 RepID=A0A8B8LX54_ABRPR|nr:zinc finger A20 and AN1 domain-containing stress-associated protein 1-like [Abrus precatorius]
MDPPLCAKCGLFGSTTDLNLCSKCYRDYLESNNVLKIEFKSSTGKTYVFESSMSGKACASGSSSTVPSDSKSEEKRCKSCNKKVGLTGFKCRCGELFCGKHRYPEKHACKVDLKETGRQTLAKQNPKCTGDKLKNRI